MTYDLKTLGILGGGQLGRMSALAAARLGIKTHIYCPESDAPASHVSARTFIGDYNDLNKLKTFADSVDFVSYEFENIPVETVRYLQTLKPVYPDDKLLDIAQDRVKEKQFLNDIGIPTAQWKYIANANDLMDFSNKTNRIDLILKTTRFGYDGKGQTRYSPDRDDAAEKLASLKAADVIAEEVVDFACEISVIIARDAFGQSAVYDPILNAHKNHILDTSTVPAPIPHTIADEARRLTEKLADAVNLCGVLALELFVTKDGRVLANEIAPRTHNSGHWTIDACAVSQFEQHVRTVCGLPVGHPARHSDAVMHNLLGDDVRDLQRWYNTASTCIHLYGKVDPKAGRKMGHVTVLSPIGGITP